VGCLKLIWPQRYYAELDSKETRFKYCQLKILTLFIFKETCDLLTHAEITEVVEQVNAQVEEEHLSKFCK
jgi:hypothetical protein